MSVGSEEDDLFEHLASKQADNELAKSEETLNDATKANLNALWQSVKSMKEEFGERDLLVYQNMDLPISAELVMVAGLMQGIALPLLETSEAKTESLGELGVCLFTGTQLFSFWDAASHTVHMPSTRDARWDNKQNRFYTIVSRYLQLACRWEGNISGGTNEDGTVNVEWDGIWAGAGATNVLEYWVHLTCQQAKMTSQLERLEQIEFSIEMRRMTS